MPDFDPNDWPRFVVLPSFSRRWDQAGLDDAAIRSLESGILADPTAAPVMRGAGGLRKIRFADPRERRGKSGSYRAGYFHYPAHGVVVLAVFWAKGEKSNLTTAECRALAAVGERLADALKKGEA